jgi:hypothetical protein
METTAQRKSRINGDDLAASNQHSHAKDFFAGLATYEITPSFDKSFSVAQITPSGQISGWAKDYDAALAQVEEWKAATLCNGYRNLWQ